MQFLINMLIWCVRQRRRWRRLRRLRSNECIASAKINSMTDERRLIIDRSHISFNYIYCRCVIQLYDYRLQIYVSRYVYISIYVSLLCIAVDHPFSFIYRNNINHLIVASCQLPLRWWVREKKNISHKSVQYECAVFGLMSHTYMCFYK